MAPARIDEDDPVVAEYDVFVTASPSEQLVLSQYPNRERERPYVVASDGRASRLMRIKPESGHVEVEMDINTGINFNKLASLKWGDALGTAKELHNKTATYGAAAGFHPAKPRGLTARTVLKDSVDRMYEIETDLLDFEKSGNSGKAMKSLVLGGQIVRHDGVEDPERPKYFIGAFRGAQLHLTKVDGTVQLRPQFPHLDAEDERNRLAASRASAAEVDGQAHTSNPRSLLQRAKTENETERGRMEDRMRKMLQAAEAEEWTSVDYVDAEFDSAYNAFNEKLFVKDVGDVPKLKSALSSDQYIDAISLPRHQSPNRARKRPPRRRNDLEEDGENDAEEG